MMLLAASSCHLLSVSTTTASPEAAKHQHTGMRLYDTQVHVSTHHITSIQLIRATDFYSTCS